MADARAAASAFARAQQAATELDRPDRRLCLIEQLIGRIDIGQDCITLTLNPTGVQQLLGIGQLPTDDPIRLTALIAEAQEVHQALLSAPDHSIASLAASLGKCRKRAAQLLRLALLAPDIVTHCISGTQPVSLTTRALLNTDLPISWQQQRATLGFA